MVRKQEATLGARWGAAGNWTCKLAGGVGEVGAGGLDVSVLLKGPWEGETYHGC